MTERTFTVTGSRYKREYVTATVTAESFDEASDKFRCGEYDDLDVADYGSEDEDVDEVTCQECGGCEDYCGCDAQNPDADAPGTLAAEDLSEGDWIVPADDYTKAWFDESEPVEVVRVGCPDSDGEHRLEFRRTDGYDDYWYVSGACRFRRVEAPDPEEIAEKRAEAERRRAEAMRRVHERRALKILLSPN